jgi:uncharacterized protein YxjI
MHEFSLSSSTDSPLTSQTRLFVRQIREVAEIFGFETRNKYQISDESRNPVGFAAERGGGFFGFILRQYLGHWRSFEIAIVDSLNRPWMTARHPFRWYFQCLEVKAADGKLIGRIEQRFAIFSKRFEVQDPHGRQLMEVSSPLWRPWTFEFLNMGRPQAVIQKKWSGLLTEAFLDKDNFLIEFHEPTLSQHHRQLILAAALFVDIIYFETAQ